MSAEWKEAEEHAKLFDQWNLAEDWSHPTNELDWPEEMRGWLPLEKSRVGVVRVRNEIAKAMDGAIVIHRGDCVAWKDGDGSYKIQGDLDVEWGGRSPIFEVKCQMVRCYPQDDGPCQGLDDPNFVDYGNVARRSGRPFYVLFVWPDRERRVWVIRGGRIDVLARTIDFEGVKNRRMRQQYWYVEKLKTLREIVADVEHWNGAPYQEALL